MSLQSAMQFLMNASQDTTLLGQIREVSGVSGDFIPGQISDAQYSAITDFATRAGYDFTPAEIKSTLERVMTPREPGEEELAEAELDLVAGGLAFNISADKTKEVTKTPSPGGPIPIPYPNQG